MSDACIILATYSDWRAVKGRKVLQLVFEVPIEQQTEVLTLLGPPGIATDKWCSIALLKEKPEIGGGGLAASLPGEKGADRETVPRTAPEPKERKPFSSLPLAQQCAIRCEDKRYWHDYLGLQAPDTVAAWVRTSCGIKSRSELGKGNHEADNIWRKLNSEFEAWELDQRYADVRR